MARKEDKDGMGSNNRHPVDRRKSDSHIRSLRIELGLMILVLPLAFLVARLTSDFRLTEWWCTIYAIVVAAALTAHGFVTKNGKG